MKKKNYVKFVLDLVMGITFALLFNKRVLGGLEFHEIAGLAIGGAVLVHLILNGQWIKNVTRAIFRKNIALKTRIGYVLNVLLLFDFMLILLSGIAISKVLLPSHIIQLGFLNQGVHIGASYLALALIGLHIGLHGVWIQNTFKKMLKVPSNQKSLGLLARALAISMLVFGVYSMVATDFVPKTVQMFSAQSHEMRGQRGDGFPEGGNAGGENRQGNGQGQGHGGSRGQMESVNPLGVVLSFGSIMGAFAVGTYYAEGLVSRRRKKFLARGATV